MSSLSVTVLKEAIQIKEQIEKLETRLAQLLGSKGEAKATVKPGRKTVSAATKAKMRAAQQARWAKLKGPSPKTNSKRVSSEARGNTAAAGKGKVSAPSKAPAKRRGTLSPEGRAKLAAAMKARWAARKKGEAALNAASK